MHLIVHESTYPRCCPWEPLNSDPEWPPEEGGEASKEGSSGRVLPVTYRNAPADLLRLGVQNCTGVSGETGWTFLREAFVS